MDKLLQQHPRPIDRLATSAVTALKPMVSAAAFQSTPAVCQPDGSRHPLPSCLVVQVDGAASRVPVTIPRGRELITKAGASCRFRTVYDVTIAPVEITSVRFAPCVPSASGMPPLAACAIAIAIQTTDSDITLDQAINGPLRLFIDADNATRAALHDALFIRTLRPCVQAGRQWQQLAALPFAAVGMAGNESLLPVQEREAPGSRLLAEYCAFPEKFDFFDIDLKSVLACCPADTRRLVLHVILPALHTAHLLQPLSATMLRPGCTPVLYLFGPAAQPAPVAEDLPIGRPGGDLTGEGIPPRYPMHLLRRPIVPCVPMGAYDHSRAGSALPV